VTKVSDLGQLLKKARTERGLSLDDLQDITKIRKRYLEAIEEGNYKVLPGNFYVRAFIKTYSETVGLEPDEVLRLYRNVIPSTNTEEQLNEPIRRKRSNVDSRKMERAGRWASTILLVSFVVLIFSIVYYFINITYEGDGSEKVGETTKITNNFEASKLPELPSTAPAAGVDKQNVLPQAQPENVPLEMPKPVISFVNTQASTHYYTVAQAESIQVELKIVGDRCWVQVKDKDSNGSDLAGKEFKNGETETWTSKDGIWVRLGKPLAVELKINGNVISIPETVNPINVQVGWSKT
jgi:transcriptional regulator with XRE-family HTH domain